MELTPREKDKLLIFTAALLGEGNTVLAQADVMESIAEMSPEIQIEATFPDGTKLVIVHQAIA